MSQIKNIKGTFDVLPYGAGDEGSSIPASEEWVRVESTLRSLFVRYGYGEIRTPVLEPTELIARGIGEGTDIVSKEMFAFDRGDTSYVLRPEVTAPVVRAYVQHHMAQKRAVQKLFYMGPCFRAERPQKGRYRQFHQFGVEVLGADDPRADAEVISLMVSAYRELGLGSLRLRVNSLGDETTRPRYREALRAYLEPMADQLSETSRLRLQQNPLRILDSKSSRERELLQNAPMLSDYLDTDSRAHFDRVQRMLTDIGIPFVVDGFLVRGLDYYTRTAFELESDEIGAQSALAGGGRYDLLAREIGSSRRVPAVGFAAGFERLFLAMRAAGIAPAAAMAVDLYVIALDADAERWAFQSVEKLRASRVAVESDLTGRSLKAQMREANRRGARYTLVIGESELQAGAARLKHMETGDEIEVSLESSNLELQIAGYVSETE